MRKLAVILVAMILFAIPSHTRAQTRECMFPNAPEIQELNDERFQRIFVEVVQAYKLNTATFALCHNTTDTTPRTIDLHVGVFTFHVVMVPRYVFALSDNAARGLLGHEIGHVVVGFRPRSMPYEIEVDLKVAETIGYEAMLACHREMPHLLETHVRYQYELGGRDAEIVERTAALLAHKNKTKPP